jgi:hypothetical protein
MLFRGPSYDSLVAFLQDTSAYHKTCGWYLSLRFLSWLKVLLVIVMMSLVIRMQEGLVNFRAPMLIMTLVSLLVLSILL